MRLSHYVEAGNGTLASLSNFVLEISSCLGAVTIIELGCLCTWLVSFSFVINIVVMCTRICIDIGSDGLVQ